MQTFAKLILWVVGCGSAQRSLDVKIIKKGRDEFVYQDGSRFVVIGAEMLSSGPVYLIDKHTIESWVDGTNRIPVTLEERDKVLADLCSWLDQSGTTYEVK